MYASASPNGSPPRGDVIRPRRPHAPNADVRHTHGALIFVLDLPGVGQNDVSVEVLDGVLAVRGVRREPAPSMRSPRYGAFERAWRLPENIDVDGVSAHLERGVLTVRVPKLAPPKPRKIAIGHEGEAWWKRAKKWLHDAVK